LARSVDGGATWLTNTNVISESGLAGQYAPSLVVGGDGNVCVAWEDERSGNPDIYFARSTDGGGTWSANLKVNDDTGSTHQEQPSLVADESGNLYAAWVDRPSAGEYSDIYFASSMDNGATWSASVPVNEDTGSTHHWYPSLAVDVGGTLYLAWQDSRNGDYDIYFARSTDGGTTWSANVRVHDDVGSADQHAPSLAVDGDGNIYVVWLSDPGGSGFVNLYFARSIDSGVTWSPDIQINDGPGGASGTGPSLAAGGSGNVYVAWQDDRNGPDIYFARSTDGGATWGANYRVNDDIGSTNQWHPSMVVDGSGNPYVAWQDERNGNHDIYTARWPDGARLYAEGSYAITCDAGGLAAWNSLAWTDTLPVGTALTMTARVGNSVVPDVRWSEWLTLTNSPADLSGLPDARYLQWKAHLSSPISTTTPSLETVTVAWDGLDYTEVGGYILADTTWTEAEAPYLVTENVLVFEEATLTVEPGVTVWFSDTRSLRVLGGLIARGTPAEPIAFTSRHVQGQPDDWGGIAFGDTAVDATFDDDENYLGGSALQYATVEYAGWGSFLYAVDAPDTAVYVDHCTIHHNGVGGLRVGGDGTFVRDSHVHDSGGTGIYNGGSSTTISGNTVSRSSSTDSAGIYNGGSSVLISGNTVSDNSSGDPSGGGGIRNHGSSVTIRSNTVDNNSADWGSGGGIYNDGSLVIISSNAINGNTANNGGGIYSSGGSVTIRGNTINGNTANGAGGGGIYSSGTSLTINGNTIGGNTANGSGGGVYWWTDGGNIIYNTIVSNTSSSDSGGIYVYGEGNGSPTVHHNTIEDNQGHDLYNDKGFSSVRLDARYNWWGTADEGAIKGMIFDYWDDGSKGLVDYAPYLTDRPDLKPAGANLNGPTAGLVNTFYDFDASVYPAAAITPITFTWQATGQGLAVRVEDDLQDTMSFAWTSTGPKLITVTVRNSEGKTSTTYAITITELSTLDGYESDDTNGGANPIATDGTPQMHTFHTTDDVDWVSFQAISGTTTVVEVITPDDSEADVVLEVYDAVGAAQDGQDNAFSPDISLSFTVPEDGTYYLRLSDARDTAGDQAAIYYVSVRVLAESAPTGGVVIVAGRNKLNDTLQPNIYHVTNGVYQLFRANGYTDEAITYLAPDTSQDPDNDGTPDEVDEVPTRARLQQVITGWVSDTVGVDRAFTLYMMDHGSYDGFYLNYVLNQPEPVSAHELDGWLDELAAARPDIKINVVIEACHSGSFIDLAETLSGAGRVVIASTGAYALAYASDDGATFSDAFVGALGRGMSLYGAFEEARWAVQQAHPDQTPWLDDDGDGTPNGVGDGQEAARRGFAYAGTLDESQWPPHIAWAVVDQGAGTIQAEVQVAAGKVVSAVWALVYPPSYEPPESGEDLEAESVPPVGLSDPDEDGVYTAPFSFAEPGTYRVVIYAADTTGLDARPREAALGGVPVLGISKAGPASVEAGDPITYTLTVFNNGTVAASNLVITDSIPTGAFYVSGGTEAGGVVSWAVPSLAAGGGSVQVSFVVTGTRTVVNADYRVSADGGFSAVGQASVMTVVEEEGPVLAIGKVGPVAARGGEPITYTLTVTNSGSVVATNLVITDALPAGAHYAHAGAGTLLLPGEIVRWEVASLAGGGGTVTVQFVVTATETIVNDDYGVSADGGVSAVGAVPVVTAVDEPVLSIGKEGPASADAGEPITYTLTVINRGVVTATNLVITDALPSGAHFVDAGVGTLVLPGEVVRWQIPSLAQDGGMVGVQFVVTATKTIVNADYRVSADGGFNAVGSQAVVTTIGPRVYLPLVMRNS
jgi:uncharacterized repeat protein (TIGR01451 family)